MINATLDQLTFSFKKYPFILLHGIALALLASWMHPASRAYWDVLDLHVFEWLNGSLAGAVNGGTPQQTGWNALWAVLNIRVMDLMPLVLMLVLLGCRETTFDKRQALTGFVGFVILLLLMLMLRQGLDILLEGFHWRRSGPSSQIDSAIRLSALYPDWKTKDSSSSSFPGDHASVLFTWLGYSVYRARNRWTWAVVATVLFFMLPRLVSGAHWLSDDLVGGGGVALVALAWGLYTPLLNPVNAWASQIARQALVRCAPVLRRLKIKL